MNKLWQSFFVVHPNSCTLWTFHRIILREKNSEFSLKNLLLRSLEPVCPTKSGRDTRAFEKGSSFIYSVFHQNYNTKHL